MSLPWGRGDEPALAYSARDRMASGRPDRTSLNGSAPGSTGAVRDIVSRVSRREVLVLGTFNGAAQAAIEHAHDDSGLCAAFHANADAAIGALDERDWRALMVDLTTPGAVRLCHEARARRALFNVPLIALTPRLTELAFSNALRAGADDVAALGAAESLRVRLANLPPERISVTDPARGEVVIADGDRGRCDVLGRVLANAGYRVRYAIDAVTARFYAQRNELALYVCNSELCDPTELILTARQHSDFPWIVTTRQLDVDAVRRDLASFSRVAVMSAHSPPENLLFVLNSLGPDSAARRRSGQRALHGSVALFRGAGQEADECGFTYSVSTRGVYIRTLLPAPAGDVWLELIPPLKTRRVRLLARVAWSRHFAQAGGESAPAGFGLRVVDGLGQDLRLWEEGARQLVEGNALTGEGRKTQQGGGFRVPLPSNRPPRPRRAITTLRGSAMVPSAAASSTPPQASHLVNLQPAAPAHQEERRADADRPRRSTRLGMGLLSDHPPAPSKKVDAASSAIGRTLPGMPAPSCDQTEEIPPPAPDSAASLVEPASPAPFERLSASELLSWPPEAWPSEEQFRAAFGSLEVTPLVPSTTALEQATPHPGAAPPVNETPVSEVTAGDETHAHPWTQREAGAATPHPDAAPPVDPGEERHATEPEGGVTRGEEATSKEWQPELTPFSRARAHDAESTPLLAPASVNLAPLPEDLPMADGVPSSRRDESQFALARATSASTSPLPKAEPASPTTPETARRAAHSPRRPRRSTQVWTLGALVALAGIFALTLTPKRLNWMAARAIDAPSSAVPSVTNSRANADRAAPHAATHSSSMHVTRHGTRSGAAPSEQLPGLSHETTPSPSAHARQPSVPASSSEATATLPPTPAAEAWTLTPLAQLPSSIPAAPPGEGLAEDLAWLFVQAPGASRVYVHGIDYGETNRWLQAKCGTRFVRLGTAPGHWSSSGLPTQLRCRQANVLRAAP